MDIFWSDYFLQLLFRPEDKNPTASGVFQARSDYGVEECVDSCVVFPRAYVVLVVLL